MVRWPGMSSRACMRDAGLCLGTIQARTHVQLALACQRSMILAQRKLRLTMQHVYGHSGNLGNECADHAAALGTFGLTSNHDVATRWIHHNISTHPRVLMPVTISPRSWNNCDAFDQMLRRFPQIANSVVFTIGSIVFLVHLTCIFFVNCDLALSLLFAHGFFVL